MTADARVVVRARRAVYWGLVAGGIFGVYEGIAGGIESGFVAGAFGLVSVVLGMAIIGRWVGDWTTMGARKGSNAQSELDSRQPADETALASRLASATAEIETWERHFRPQLVFLVLMVSGIVTIGALQIGLSGSGKQGIAAMVVGGLLGIAGAARVLQRYRDVQRIRKFRHQGVQQLRSTRYDEPQ